MIVGSEDASTDRGCEAWLQSARLLAGDTLHIEAEVALEGEDLVELGIVVGVARHHQRPAHPISDLDAGCRFELSDERRETFRRFDVESQERLFAVVDLGDGREHAGGDDRGGLTLGVVKNGDGQTTLRGAPRNRESDQSPADDRYVGDGGFLPSRA